MGTVKFLRQCFAPPLGHMNLEQCIQDIARNSLAEALENYSGNVGDYTAEMLTLDGCFIIELLIRWNMGRLNHDSYVRSMRNSIYYDLLLVDNQIPFFILSRLFHKLKGDEELDNADVENELLTLAKKFFNHEGQFSWAKSPGLLDLSNASEVRHLLDLQYKLIISTNDTTISIDQTDNSYLRGIPGANELEDYGVKFYQDEDEHTKMFDVKFEGTNMMIPRFEIKTLAPRYYWQTSSLMTNQGTTTSSRGPN